MTRARSVLLAALIICSAVVGAVGPALAQTATDSGPVTYEYTGSPTTLIVDTSNLDGGSEFTVEYTTQGGPSTGTTVLARETYNTANLKEDQLLFFNDGAYESVNVTVSDYSGGEPTFDSKSGLLGGVNLVRTVVGTTGGDSDLTCDTSDRIGNMVSGVENLDCTAQPGSTTVNTTGTDAAQTKLDIYQSAQNSKAQADNYQTTLENYLSDTKTQARIIGKNAYIKSLNKGSSKSAAKTASKQAVADYYAKKQVNLMNEYAVLAQNYDYLHGIANNESSISSTLDSNQDTFVGTYHTHPYGDGGQIEYQGLNSVSYTLTNGSSHTYQAPKVFVDAGYDSGDNINPTLTAHTAPNNVESSAGSGRSSVHLESLMIRAPNDNYQNLKVVQWQEFNTLNSEIQSQNSQVQSDMDTLAENTYSAYQAGEINNSDLVDPYVLANQQSAGDDFQGWTAAQLTLMGQNSPENFDQIGSFNITTESGTQYEGVLFSQENPASGQFEANNTYNPNQIGGTQYVVTSDRIVELESNFTVDDITTTDGQTVQNVTIQKTTYETSNVTELKQQYEDLAYKRAQIEAREKALKQSAGGGLLGGGSVPPVVALAVIGTLLTIVVLQN
ncbi:hypothetical protein [Haloarcula sp. CBA1131]|uniref:hypothetical protein n=1 Tax=Haloarcula sp. CBA1131 TaxID=1853686 RepID=UPI0017835104|nr:hypothetical protein [Haloarcula sp. CBA1131]